MRYRALGNTGLMVSEIGLGAEWLERHSAEEGKAVIDRTQCVGCTVCAQVCPFGAIVKEEV